MTGGKEEIRLAQNAERALYDPDRHVVILKDTFFFLMQ